jgi:hypothetical protein
MFGGQDQDHKPLNTLHFIHFNYERNRERISTGEYKPAAIA